MPVNLLKYRLQACCYCVPLDIGVAGLGVVYIAEGSLFCLMDSFEYISVTKTVNSVADLSMIFIGIAILLSFKHMLSNKQWILSYIYFLSIFWVLYLSSAVLELQIEAPNYSPGRLAYAIVETLQFQIFFFYSLLILHSFYRQRCEEENLPTDSDIIRWKSDATVEEEGNINSSSVQLKTEV